MIAFSSLWLDVLRGYGLSGYLLDVSNVKQRRETRY